MDDNALDIILRLQDELSPALAKAQAALRDAAKQAVTAGDSGAKSFDGFNLNVLKGIPIIGQFIAAMSVERVLAFGAAAIEAAGHIDDLALATGSTREEIQRMGFVGEGFGLGMDEMARGVEQFSAKLANGDQNAVAAVQKLGLNVKELIASGPTEAFLTFADAAGRVQDPMQRGGLAAEAFGGKLGKILLPALADLRREMADVPQTAIISDANIKKADAFDDSLKHASTTLKAWTVNVFGALVTYNDWLEKQNGITEATDMFGRALERVTTGRGQDIELSKQSISTADLLANRLKALRTEALVPLSDAQKTGIVELESYGLSQKEIAQLLVTSESAVKRYTDSLKEQEKAVKVAAAAAKEWDDLLTHLSTVTFGLAMDHEKQWRDEQFKNLQRANAAILAEFDAQTKLNAAWGLDASGAIQVQSSALDALNLKLAELHANRVEGISQEKEEQLLMKQYTDQLLEQAQAQDVQTTALARTTDQVDAATESYIQLGDAIGRIGAGSGVSDSAEKRLASFSDLLMRNPAANPSGLFAGLPSVQTRDVGGPVQAGMPYYIGRAAQPELFIPSSPGTMVPHGGAAAAGPKIIQLVVDGRVLAAVVDDHGTHGMKLQRQYPAP